VEGEFSPGFGSRPSEPLLLGRIGFVNVLPVYLFLEQNRTLFREVSDTPSRLNKMLRQGLLDVSPVSSVEYAGNPGRYRILGDLSVSSVGRVRSVLVLSQAPMEKWGNAPIQCPMESETSVALLQLLLRNYWGIDVGLVEEGCVSEPVALLRIGDRALREAASGKWAHIWDLGEAWHRWTGLPFVFALWLVREGVAQSRATQLKKLHGALLRARDTGLSKLDACAEKARRVLGGLELDLLEYFQGLTFSLEEGHIRGLNRFFEELAKAGLIKEKPVLRLWPPP
jgi:chorismate dehydratase